MSMSSIWHINSFQRENRSLFGGLNICSCNLRLFCVDSFKLEASAFSICFAICRYHSLFWQQAARVTKSPQECHQNVSWQHDTEGCSRIKCKTLMHYKSTRKAQKMVKRKQGLAPTRVRALLYNQDHRHPE